jgi:hypothetical protein
MEGYATRQWCTLRSSLNKLSQDEFKWPGRTSFASTWVSSRHNESLFFATDQIREPWPFITRKLACPLLLVCLQPSAVTNARPTADEQLGQSPKLISAKIRSWLSSIMKYLRRDGARVVADGQSQRLRAKEPMSNCGSFVFFVNGSSRFQGQQLLPGQISVRQ